LENLGSNVDINRAWESVVKRVRTSAKQGSGYCMLRKHKLWFDAQRSALVDRRKQADCRGCRIQMNPNNLNNVKRDAIGHFRNEMLLNPSSCSSGRHSCIAFRSFRFQISARRPAVLTELFSRLSFNSSRKMQG
jgi:hypothetical protein